MKLVLTSYGSMIIVFTCIYFTLTFVSDHEDAVRRYFYYNAAGEDLASGRIVRINPYPNDSRAFTGMEVRLWGTVDDYMPTGIYRDLGDIEKYRARWGAQLPFEGVVRYRSRSVLPVLADCFHLSVMTITSVGYGNIAPRTWPAKLATDIEALAGSILLVVGLGLIFSGATEQSITQRDGQEECSNNPTN